MELENYDKPRIGAKLLNSRKPHITIP